MNRFFARDHFVIISVLKKKASGIVLGIILITGKTKKYIFA